MFRKLRLHTPVKFSLPTSVEYCLSCMFQAMTMGKLTTTASIATTTTILLVKAQVPTVILRLIPRRFSSDSAAAIMTAQQAHAIIVLGIAMLDIALAVTLGID